MNKFPYNNDVSMSISVKVLVASLVSYETLKYETKSFIRLCIEKERYKSSQCMRKGSTLVLQHLPVE